MRFFERSVGPEDERPPRARCRQITAGRRRCSRPRLEVLEDRTLLNVDFVTNTNDSGSGSLSATIGSASPGDTIAFGSGVTGTISLKSTLTISENLNIEGPDAGNLNISGNSAGFPVFDVNDGVNATFTGLAIAEGTYGIYSQGTLTVTDSTISDNSGAQGAGRELDVLEQLGLESRRRHLHPRR